MGCAGDISFWDAVVTYRSRKGRRRILPIEQDHYSPRRRPRFAPEAPSPLAAGESSAVRQSEKTQMTAARALTCDVKRIHNPQNGLGLATDGPKTARLPVFVMSFVTAVHMSVQTRNMPLPTDPYRSTLYGERGLFAATYVAFGKGAEPVFSSDRPSFDKAAGLALLVKDPADAAVRGCISVLRTFSQAACTPRGIPTSPFCSSVV